MGLVIHTPLLYQSKKYGGRLTLSPCRFFPMSRLIRFSKYVHEHLSRKRKKFSLVCGLNDLFSNITRISKLVGQEVKKRRRRHSCRAAVIGKTGKNVDLPIFYEKEHREGISDAMLTRRSCLSKIYGGGPCGHTGRKSIDLCCGSKLEEQLKFVATLLQQKGTVVSTYQA